MPISWESNTLSPRECSRWVMFLFSPLVDLLNGDPANWKKGCNVYVMAFPQAITALINEEEGL
jgi:hypothetical protein